MQQKPDTAPNATMIRLMALSKDIRRWPFPGRCLFFAGLCLLIGVLDWYTGDDLSLGVFYLLPISFWIWHAQSVSWLWPVVFCTLLWHVANQHEDWTPALHCWNSAVRFGFFVSTGFLLSQMCRFIEFMGIQAQKDAVELKRFSNRFEAYMDNHLAVAWMKDDNLRFLWCNRPFEDRFNMKLQDWDGKNDYQVWPPEVAKSMVAMDRRVLAENRCLQTTEYLADPHGASRLWLVFRFPIPLNSHSRYVGGMAVDITEQQKQQQHITRLAAAVHFCQTGIVVTDPDGIVTDWNPAAERIFRQSEANMIGHSVETIFQDEQRSAYQRHRQEALSSVCSSWTTVFGDGDNKQHLAISLAPVIKNATIENMVIVADDVTKQEQNKAQLQTIQADLWRANQILQTASEIALRRISQDEGGIESTLARIGITLQMDFVGLCRLHPEERKCHTWSSPQLPAWEASSTDESTEDTAYQSGQIIIGRPQQIERFLKPLRERTGLLLCRWCALIPWRVKDNRWQVVAFGSLDGRARSKQEIQALQRLSSLASWLATTSHREADIRRYIQDRFSNLEAVLVHDDDNDNRNT